ncbi:MAG: L,D-transpeptidase [Deltaproteobacteria bacterium]|nr:L,D-transpeptidase [Deltaproteobacteria bacterium]
MLVLLICLGGFWGLLGLHGGAAAEEADYTPLCREFEQAGLDILNSGMAYGVPYVEIKVPTGASVTSICKSVPSLRADFNRCRDKISFFNALHPLYIKDNAGQPNSLEADTLKIPLDRTMVPEIFPAVDDSLASYDKFILVDIGKGFLALYAQGQLQRVFPISGGRAEKATPLMDFTVAKKEEEHWSTIYDTWMPWSLLIKRPYYIHGGALPGRSDSAGCIRLFPHDAEELYHLVEVGTPGRIIETSPLEQTYPAFFCR